MRRAVTLSLSGIATLAAVMLFAAPAPEGLEFTATIARVAGAPDTARFEILRWSTDDEREKLVSAWNLKAPAPASAAAGRGGAKGGKGKGPAPAAVKATPEDALAKALQAATTVGYLWSSENAGYALRYAGRFSNPDGSQRIILITQRRLGSMNQLWKPTFEGAPNTNDFSVIELHVNAKGEGEGKASLMGKLAVDASKIVTLENYSALPVVFEKVHRKVAQP
ncbi:MAG: hypothetical protein ABI824_02850 [Acidobacteriota bacterium]